MPNSVKSSPLTNETSHFERWRGFCDRIKQKIKDNPWGAGASVLFVAIALILIWPYIAITIYPGNGGVFYSRFFGGVQTNRVYDEGIHFIWPWNKMYVFDARIQQEAYDMVILMDSGMSVQISLVCNHHLEKHRLPELLQRVGEDYKKRLLLPALNTAVRSVLGNYDFEESHWMLSRLQDEVQIKAIEQLEDYPVVVDAVAVTNITLPQRLSEAITLKQEANQNYLAERYRVLQAEQKFRKSYIEAEAVRVTQETINKGLNESFLRWSGIQATKELAQSDNAKVVLIGGKDGLPIILNPDSPMPGASNPEVTKSSQTQVEEKPQDDKMLDAASKPSDQPLTAEKVVQSTGESLLQRSNRALEYIGERLERMSSDILSEFEKGQK